MLKKKDKHNLPALLPADTLVACSHCGACIKRLTFDRCHLKHWDAQACAWRTTVGGRPAQPESSTNWAASIRHGCDAYGPVDDKDDDDGDVERKEVVDIVVDIVDDIISDAEEDVDEEDVDDVNVNDSPIVHPVFA